MGLSNTEIRKKATALLYGPSSYRLPSDVSDADRIKIARVIDSVREQNHTLRRENTTRRSRPSSFARNKTARSAHRTHRSGTQAGGRRKSRRK